MNHRRTKLWLMIVIATVVVRILAALAYNQPNLSVDSSGYDVMGRNLLAYGLCLPGTGNPDIQPLWPPAIGSSASTPWAR